MVSSHEALLFVAPLEEWEVNNPQAHELVLIAKSETVAHLKTQGAELHACLVGIVATEDEHEVAVLGAHCLFHLLPYFGLIELVDA